MKKIMLIAGLAVCAHLGLAEDAEWIDAKQVDVSKPSPEATMVATVQALVQEDKDAFMALCSDEFKVNEKKAYFIRYKGICKTIAKADLEKEFLYKVAKPDPEKDEYYVEYMIGRKGKDGHIRANFKIGKFGDKFLITGV